jgi:Nickel responsive protein SCO4226-like
MKTMKNSISVTIALLLITGAVAISQNTEIAEANLKDYTLKKHTMKKEAKLNTYIIERDMPGAGDLSAEQLKGISQLSNSVLKEQGPDIKWLHSYVTDDKIYCVYKGVDQLILKEHAKKAEFPITSIKKLANVISPETATASLN